MKKIAIIGSGISGLSAAWLLSKEYTVSVFEKENWYGGHAHTIDVQFDDVVVSPDTGFMVFNLQGYPHLAKFLSYLNVDTKNSDMSFSVSLRDGQFEFSSSNLFADWKNLFNPNFFRFLFEIPRFNTRALRALKETINENTTIDDFLNEHNFSERFRQQYLYPMASLIWSAPPRVAATFPLEMILNFMNNHNLLKLRPGLYWRSVVGGSREYVNTIVTDIENRGGTLFLGTPVESVTRNSEGVSIVSTRGAETFDAVILATHSDISLQLLTDATEQERTVLGSFTYQSNRVLVHSDPSLMPKRKQGWAAWNFCDIKSGSNEDEVSLTYNMNILNGISDMYPLFVTINPSRLPDKALIHGDFNYSHPMHSADVSRAQKQLPELQGKQNTYFCGAYFGYGFHEDGLVAGLEVAKRFGITPPWEEEKS